MRRICAVNTFVILICLLAAIGLFTIVAQAFYLFTH